LVVKTVDSFLLFLWVLIGSCEERCLMGSFSSSTTDVDVGIVWGSRSLGHHGTSIGSGGIIKVLWPVTNVDTE
jgi:hypothetical protein